MARKPSTQPGTQASIRGKIAQPKISQEKVKPVAPEPELAATPISDDGVREQIAGLAYRLAEARGFAPGHEVEDWLRAEAQVKADLGLTGRPN
jgi:hypothetical protein